ncbi:MAG: hypothetical protein LBJ15_02980 [Comamonas sp.]|jgi:hypothetical protein|uniref:DUF6630 family protein n=1 Tax=Comamonas sp. TaxID=34028 RepID=UPI00281ED061|nr:hypothetical protein [Comamonas sp.]MDR0212950.1 hypothetical protein [Comamonas sp.]
MNLQHLIGVLQALPADLQGKASEGERLLDLRRNTEGLSLRLAINLRDNNGSELIFDALLQLPARPSPEPVQLQSLSLGNSFNKRAQRYVDPMVAWAIKLLTETPGKIQRGARRKPQWQATLQSLVTALSRDADWTLQWLLRNEMRLEDLRKKQRLAWVLRQLADEGHVARVDWKDDESVIDGATDLLEKHYPKLAAQAPLDELEDMEFGDAEEAIAAVNTALAPLELRLHIIGSDDDSYLLSLQDASSTEHLRQALQDAGLNLQERDA